MVKDRSAKEDGPPAEHHQAKVDRLVTANAQVQAEVTRRLGSSPSWEFERVLLKGILNQIPELVYAKDTSGRFVTANHAAARDNGLERSEHLIGKTDFDLHPPEMAQRFFEIEQEIMASGTPMIDMEELRTDESGATKWLLTTKVPMRDDAGQIIGLIGVARNITERKRAEQDWKTERALFRAMIDQVPDYLFVKDIDSRFMVANRAVAEDLGLGPEDLIGKTDFELHQPELAARFFADEQHVVRSKESLLDIEEYVVDASDNKKWLSTSKMPLRNERSEVIGIVGISRNITERKRAEDQIRFMALHDALTGLPNRTLLMDRLTQALLHAKREDRRVTVMFVDLDNFKQVNDSGGHNAGDRLLKVVAERMVNCVRATDTVARLGGDEFVVLLINPSAGEVVPETLIENLRAAIAASVPIDGQEFHVTCSIGLATAPEDGTDAETLIMNADAAMYQAKENGRDHFQFYTTQINEAAHKQRMIHAGLRGAIANNEITLLYQPQVDLRTGSIFAVEALARWHHPELGCVSPSQFIPAAEESGLIVSIGDWILRAACRQNKVWQIAGMTPITISVNVSGCQIRQRNWVAQVMAALHETGMAPSHLELELTESVLMQDVQQAISAMRELQAFGVRFAIDDFGMGYSSLSALKRLPVSRLKIDMCFVRNLPCDAHDRSITRAIISLGKELNMRVIAEGVETDAQLAFLQDNHCDEIQGYHFSKPVASQEIPAMLQASGCGQLGKGTL